MNIKKLIREEISNIINETNKTHKFMFKYGNESHDTESIVAQNQFDAWNKFVKIHPDQSNYARIMLVDGETYTEWIKKLWDRDDL